MRNVVLDAWAIMPWLKGHESAVGHVRLLFDAADRRECKLLMNIVDMGEVFYLCVKARDLDNGQRVLEILRTRVTTVSASDDLVMMAAKLKALRAKSYADGFAAATAISRKLPLVTGDPELRTTAASDQALQIEWITN